MRLSRTNIVRVLIAVTATVLSTAATGRSADEDQKSPDAVRDLDAVQCIYREGVPHTDRYGNRLMAYDSERSFFQIGIWGNPFGEIYGYKYDLKTLTDAGFNTIWPWHGRKLENILGAAADHGLQVVYMGHLAEEEAATCKDHPNWLGNVWCDEPTGSFWGKDMQGKFDEFLAYKKRINKTAPGRAVFINDVPWIMPPATAWWTKWNTAGDVACHDNYPIMNRQHRARLIGGEKLSNGIDRTVNLAAAVNQEQKPVWLIVGAFRVQGAGSFPFRHPTPMQLRAQVYAGLIHGATGIIYFCWDTYVCRDGHVIGMSPDPQVQYLEPGPGKPRPSPARPMDLAAAEALWMAATQTNREIHELTASLLSSTVVDVDYGVEVKGESISEDPIRCLLKPHPDGGYVLLTVNLDDAVLSATYTFPSALQSAQRLFENRPSAETNDDKKTFTDHYEPFDVHVYRIVAEPSVPSEGASGT